MRLPLHKTKIVCTIGPASRSLTTIEDMIQAGMNVARFNFSHGDLAQHAQDILRVRQAAVRTRRIVDTIIDLPGVKMRIGKLAIEPLVLKKGQKVTLTTRNVLGTASIIPVDYKPLVKSASRGGTIYLNDGFIQLKVEQISGSDIACRVVIGGPLRSHKGLNMPGAKLFVNAITPRDLKFIDFGLKHGVTTFGLSFVEKASDIIKVRKFAERKGKDVFLVAKIERREAIENFDEILKVADAVMVARGDLGLEIPMEEVPIIQKILIRKANIAGRPVITATQMLGSMTQNLRPTRAEVNDVANAILDGTDAIMLSEETAAGDYPVQAVRMMARIAVSTEQLSNNGRLSAEIREEISATGGQSKLTIPDVISLNVVRAVEKLKAKYILTPTSTGSTAQLVCRLKPRCWVLAFSIHKRVCEFLAFSYGVYPFFVVKKSQSRPEAVLRKVKAAHLVDKGDAVVITERRFSWRPGGTDSLHVVVID